MTGTWLILTEDSFFAKKISLLCERHALRSTVEITKGDAPLLGCIHDIDTAKDAPIPEGLPTVLRFSRHRTEGCYSIPARIGEIEELLLGKRVGLTLHPEEHTVTLGQRSVSLTDMEYALLERLLAAEGAAVSQEELLRDVWHGEAGAGTVTVYVHYLRQKLEVGGERILRIKRGCGYYIDEKYARRT